MIDLTKCYHYEYKFKWFKPYCTNCGEHLTIEKLMKILEEL